MSVFNHHRLAVSISSGGVSRVCLGPVHPAERSARVCTSLQVLPHMSRSPLRRSGPHAHTHTRRTPHSRTYGGGAVPCQRLVSAVVRVAQPPRNGEARIVSENRASPAAAASSYHQRVTHTHWLLTPPAHPLSAPRPLSPRGAPGKRLSA